ncbi:hypothetical protein [Acidithiobacillus sp.]|uniref:hypothetical protein n=1 Tax=Acidithiobacillus sp. TaxID=1872118 RepID=UPI0025B9BDE1|nr:hypothetical protein [Acidithiobacillus sp.]
MGHLLTAAERLQSVCCRPSELNGGGATIAIDQQFANRVLTTRHHDRKPGHTGNAFGEPQPIDLQSAHDYNYDATRKWPDAKRIVQPQTFDAILSHGKPAVKTLAYYFF